MGSIPLTLDPSKKLFSVPVLVWYNSRPENTLMYVDSGSTITSITTKEAESLGIDVRSLPTEPVGGVGGLSQMGVLYNVTLGVFDSTRSPVAVQLKKLGVNPSRVRRVKQRTDGIYKKTRETFSEMICLLGLDFIGELHGELVLRPDKGTGEIKF